MSEAKPEPSKKPENGQKKDRRRSMTFEEMLERRNFSVPDEAFKLYRSLLNPFAQYVQQFRAAGVPEVNIKQMIYLVNANVGYYKRRLECLKIIADFAHAKPSRGKATKYPENPPGEKTPPTSNPYENMTTEQLIAGLPTTDEQFDSGPTQPGS